MVEAIGEASLKLHSYNAGVVGLHVNERVIVRLHARKGGEEDELPSWTLLILTGL